MFRMSYIRNEQMKAELKHYGIKGMKWGIRRTPEQLGHRRKKLNTSIVSDMIASGRVSTKDNREKQNRHIPGSRGYNSKTSILYGTLDDAQRLVDEFSGTGQPLLANGKWINKERISAPYIIGLHVNPVTGKKTKTNKAVIVYGKTGSHIYPAQHKKGD